MFNMLSILLANPHNHMTCYHFHFAEDKTREVKWLTWGHTARKLQNQGSDTSCSFRLYTLCAKHLVRLHVCLTSCILSLSYLTCKMEFLPPTSRSSELSAAEHLCEQQYFIQWSLNWHSLPFPWGKDYFHFWEKNGIRDHHDRVGKGPGSCLYNHPLFGGSNCLLQLSWSRSNK